jgi:AcrR family transcriptional regulator
VTPPTPQKRSYDSARRRAQAGETRRRVLACARSLFLADGYGPTTIAAIAAESGVSVETIYRAWSSKAGIVRALLRQSLRGAEDAPPLVEGDAIKAVIAEPAAPRQLKLYGELLADVQPALAPLTRLLRESAAADAQLAGALAQHKSDRLQGMQSFAELLHSRGALMHGLTVDAARDILWTMNSGEVYELLVQDRGWTPEAYGSWIAEALKAALLGI